MSYYMGDFYRGDPGIGSFFAGLAKKAVGFIPGIGPIASSVLQTVMPGGARTAGKEVVQKVAAGASSAIIKHPVLSAAGAAGALGTMAAGGAAVSRMMSGGAHGGHVLKKCGQPLKSGKVGKCHRRMNPFNPHAARRSARRLHSLIRHYRKYIGFVSARKPKGRPFIKRRKK